MSKKGFSDKVKKPYFPFVSVCTPTFNRRPFIPYMFDCFRNQDYPKDRMEWIIVDDGTDPIKDLVDSANIPQIKYFRPPKRMNLGEKRNYMHKQTKGSIIVYMDDDDYYPPERVSHAVEKLMSNREAMCAGSSELYIYFKHIRKMMQCGPYGPNHATAGTFAFRASLLSETRYVDNAALAEERAFLKDYTIPFVQLDPFKTILVFSHIHNTFDKKRMLENPHPSYFKESSNAVEMFIKNANEAHIKKFFMEDIDDILALYPPGHPNMKPEVLIQTKQIEEERRKVMEKMLTEQPTAAQPQHQQIPPGMPREGLEYTIMMKADGKEPVQLTIPQVVELLQKQESEMTMLKRKIVDLEETIGRLQRIAVQSKNSATSATSGSANSKTTPTMRLDTGKLKSEPEIYVEL